MFKEIGRVTELLKYPQNKILDLDKVARINGEGLTLTIATEECAELIQAITKLKRYGFYDRYKKRSARRSGRRSYLYHRVSCFGLSRYR